MKGQFKEYFAIEKDLKKQGFTETRAELVEQFTDGAKAGLRQLSREEYNQFVAWLNVFTSDKPGVIDRGRAMGKVFAVENKQRRKIIALFCQMGYVKDLKPDMDKINAWAVKYGHLDNTDLNGYHGADLGKLVLQAKNVYSTFIAGAWK